jgi:hypothetical protein
MSQVKLCLAHDLLNLISSRNRAEVGKRLVVPSSDFATPAATLIVPLLAGSFTGFAADAARGVDELGDDHAFSRFTRKPLYSGVPELGSSTEGVRLLMSGPLTLPRNPQ